MAADRGDCRDRWRGGGSDNNSSVAPANAAADAHTKATHRDVCSVRGRSGRRARGRGDDNDMSRGGGNNSDSGRGKKCPQQ